jgi:hypothetical protein
MITHYNEAEEVVKDKMRKNEKRAVLEVAHPDPGAPAPPASGTGPGHRWAGDAKTVR